MLGKDVSSAVVGCRVEVTLFHGVGSLFADVCLAVLYIIENEVLKSLFKSACFASYIWDSVVITVTSF